MTTANAFKAVDAAPVAVEKANIQVALQGLEQQVTDPNKGLFGPGSMFWEVNRHTLVYFLGAVQSVQMQLCHPWIAICANAALPSLDSQGRVRTFQDNVRSPPPGSAYLYLFVVDHLR